jgi:hypothetical protein
MSGEEFAYTAIEAYCFTRRQFSFIELLVDAFGVA